MHESWARPFSMVVELGKIREFAAATGASAAGAHGAPGDLPVSPPTFLATTPFWQTADSNPWHGIERDFRRVLHGEQEFVFTGEPPRAGAVLNGRARIERVYDKVGKRGGSMRFFDVVTEFRDQDGRLVAEARSTSIETSHAAGR